MKIFVVHILLVWFTCNLVGQTVYKTNKGQITFRSDAPLEIISASSGSLEGIIDAESMTFAFVVSIISFKGFNNGLQQQHFYENYLETSKYPDASFSGKIIEEINLTIPGTYQARAKGQLKIHGRSQERIIRIELTSNGSEIKATAKFMVPLTDHQIEVPKIVNQKIAKEIEVTVRATLTIPARS